MAVTGGCCLAVATLLEGTVAHDISLPRRQIASMDASDPQSATTSENPQTTTVRIGNPAGVLRATVCAGRRGEDILIPWVSYERSAQVLLQGMVPIYQASPELRGFFASRN